MTVTIHLSAEEAEALQRTASTEGRSPEDVARRAVLEYTSGWRRERERLLDTILTEDAKLLRRLGGA
jgi:predicted transcriptional regulator